MESPSGSYEIQTKNTCTFIAWKYLYYTLVRVWSLPTLILSKSIFLCLSVRPSARLSLPLPLSLSLSVVFCLKIIWIFYHTKIYTDSLEWWHICQWVHGMVISQVSLLSYLYVTVRHRGNLDDRVVHLKRPCIHDFFDFEIFILQGRLLQWITFLIVQQKHVCLSHFYHSYKQNMVYTFSIVSGLLLRGFQTY